MALAELARLEQLERLVGQVEQPDQVGDGGAAAADAPRQLLLGEAEVLDQGGAGARLLDRVEVLADHVLDQRHLQPLGQLGVADDRRHLLQAGLLRGAPAALAGDQLVAAVGQGADEQRLDDAAALDRGGEAGQRLGVEAGARLVRVRLDQLDRQLAQLAGVAGRGALGQDRRQAAADAALPLPLPAALATARQLPGQRLGRRRRRARRGRARSPAGRSSAPRRP